MNHHHHHHHHHSIYTYAVASQIWNNCMQMLRTEFPQDVPSGGREWAAKQRKKAWIQADFMRLPEAGQGSRSRGPSRGSRGVRACAGKVPTSSTVRPACGPQPVRARHPERVFPLQSRTGAAGAGQVVPPTGRAPAVGRSASPARRGTVLGTPASAPAGFCCVRDASCERPSFFCVDLDEALALRWN